MRTEHKKIRKNIQQVSKTWQKVKCLNGNVKNKTE